MNAPFSYRYAACPTDACHNRKVQPADGNLFYCDRCHQTTPQPVYRYLLSMIIQDETGSTWLTCFDREAERIIGHNATRMQQLLETNAPEYAQIFQQATGQDCVFGIKVTNNTNTKEEARGADEAEPYESQQARTQYILLCACLALFPPF